MSRRYATLASLMTGRGGVHEVSSDRLVAVPASGSGVERIRPPAVKARRVAGEDSEDSEEDAFPSDDGLAMTSSNAFESHMEYVVPSSGASAAEARTLHVLRLAKRWRDAFSADLTKRARAKTRKGYEARERLVLGPDGGVVVSNVGGFQSAHDLLEPDTWCYTSDEDEDDAAATEDAAAETEDVTFEKKDTAPARATKGWGLVSAVACLAHERVRDASKGERPITAEDLYGWLNANDAGDFNKLHEHGGGDSWSGVFYVQCPPPSRPAASDDDESESDEDLDGTSYGMGALGLRCHDVRTERSVPGVLSSSPAGDEKVRYLRYHPRAGDVLLFRGDVLHAVESNGWARGGVRESSDVDFGALRLSVAFNEDSLANDRKIAERAAANGAEGVG
jgi:hypothetical protein